MGAAENSGRCMTRRVAGCIWWTAKLLSRQTRRQQLEIGSVSPLQSLPDDREPHNLIAGLHKQRRGQLQDLAPWRWCRGTIPDMRSDSVSGLYLGLSSFGVATS